MGVNVGLYPIKKNLPPPFAKQGRTGAYKFHMAQTLPDFNPKSYIS